MRSMSGSAARSSRSPVVVGRSFSWLALLWLMVPALARAAPVVLEDISFGSLPGGSFEIKLDFSGNPQRPNGYVIESPPRMVFDFPDTQSALPQKKYALSFDLAKSAVVVSSEDRTRLIINLNDAAGYDLSTQGDGLTIVVGSGQGNAASREQYAGEVKSTQGPAAGSGLTAVDFQRGESGEGMVAIGLGSKDIAVDITQIGRNLVAMFYRTSLPESLDRKLDVMDFATPVKSIDTTAEGTAVKVVVETVGEYDYLAYQADNNYASLEFRVGGFGGVLAGSRGQGRAQPGAANP
jgi:type IV pilus assembly protein PilQ